MPVFKRTPIPLSPNPDNIKELDPSTEVYQIPYTGEIFTNYDEYLKRIHMYRRDIWSCETTGKTGLTYEEAVESEIKNRAKVGERFPECWKKKAFEIIHCNPLAMNPLIDEMYEHFRHNVYVGEVVYATLRTGSRAVLGKIIEKIPINTPNGTVIESLSASGDVATTPIKSTTSSSASTPSTSRAVKQEDTSDKDHPFMYKVHLLNRNLDLMSENESDGEEKQDSGSARPAATRAANRQLVHVLAFRNISRDRTILSKTLFKKFIKEYATREQYNNAPWAVRQDVIKLYGITKTLSASQIAEIERKKNGGKLPKKDEDGEEGDGQKTRRSRKKEPAQKFPMDDLDLLALGLGSHDPELSVQARPEPNRDFDDVPKDLVPALLMVWDFLGVFSKTLNLSSFSLDEFQKSLSHSAYRTKNPVLTEAFGSILQISSSEYRRKVSQGLAAPLTTRQISNLVSSATTSATNLMDSFNADFASGTADVEMTDATADTSSANENHIDAAKSPMRPKTKGINGQDIDPDFIWEKLFLEFLNELTPEERSKIEDWYKWSPGKYQYNDPSYITAPSNYSFRTNAMYTSETAPLARLMGWESVLIGSIKDLMPYSETICGLSKWELLCLLVGKRPSDVVATKNEDSEEDIIGSGKRASGEDMFSGDDGDADVGRKRRRRDVDYSSFFDEADTNSNSMKRTSSSTGRGTSSVANLPSKLRVFGVCEEGFLNLTVGQRVGLLKFLIDEVVLTSNVIRESIDESYERVVELKREKRELVRELKAVRAERDEVLHGGDGKVAQKSNNNDDDDDEDMEVFPMMMNVAGQEDSEEELPPQEKEPAGRGARTSQAKSAVSNEDSGSASNVSKSRAQKIKEEAARREEEERRRLEEYERNQKLNREKQREARERRDRERKYEEQENDLLRQLTHNEIHLRVAMSQSRIIPLGRDRFFNRYWWFDSSISTSLANSFSSRRYKNHWDWGTGIIFVEDVGLGPNRDESKIPTGSAEEAIAMQGLTAGEWGYYTNPEQIESVMDWLDPRGIREIAMKNSMKRLFPQIQYSMDKRCETLASATARQEVEASRRSGRTRRNGDMGWEQYLEYTNKMAK